MNPNYSSRLVRFKLTYVLGIFLMSLISNISIAQKTIVKGFVFDELTHEPMAYANVYFSGTSVGTPTGGNGDFELQILDLDKKYITVSYLGYKDNHIKIRPGNINSVEVFLEPNGEALLEVIVRPDKKKKYKDTAAISLFRRVMKSRDKNSQDALDSYAFEEYSKVEFDIYNIKEEFQKYFFLKPFEFIFEYIDTTEDGVAYLPALLKESISEVYYNKEPKEKKRKLVANKFSGMGDPDVSASVDANLDDIDFYRNTIEINGKPFISPFAQTGLVSYKYFLTDSAYIDDVWCYKLEFTPKQKLDLAFTGEAWIHDESASIKSISVYLLGKTNLNYITDIQIQQEFDQMDNNRWFKVFEKLESSFNLTENKRNMSFRILMQNSRKNIDINPKLDPRIFEGEAYSISEEAYDQPDSYWELARHQTLSDAESGVYEMVDRVKASPAYKTFLWWGHLMFTAYMKFGPVEVGKIYQMYSRNELEGARYRIGLRANRMQFRDKFTADAYVAYGDKDQIWKYYIGGRFRLKSEDRLWHWLGGSYQYDWTGFANGGPWTSHDNIFISNLRKNPISNLYLIKRMNLKYQREWTRGFFSTFDMSHKTIFAWPDSYNFGSEIPPEEDAFQTLELSMNTRWRIGDLYFQQKEGFEGFSSKYNPVIQFNYTYSPEGILGSDYNYHKLLFSIDQEIGYPLGISRYRVEYGKIFGTIPYPLLKIHRGNETYIYSSKSYNLMQEFEYASDHWTAVWLDHHFQGLFLNRVPLINKLKWRSALSFKALYSQMSDDNITYLEFSNGLKDLNGFYAEAGFGIENIFKVLRIDFIWRLTHTEEYPNQRFQIKVGSSHYFF